MSTMQHQKQGISKARGLAVAPMPLPLDINPVILGMESPDQTYNHTSISFSLWRFVGADCKKYFLFLII